MAALCVILTAACGYDYRDNRIPNYLVLLAAVLGMGWQAWDGGVPGALAFWGQAALAMALLYPFFQIGGLGAGDVKLLGAAAGYLPFGKVLIFLFCSLLIAAMISLVKMCRKGIFRQRVQYLSAYLKDVMLTGEWKLYQAGGTGEKSRGICLSGPILLSVLLYLGGVY